MTITIDLKPETLAALRAEAEARGQTAEELAAEQLNALYADDEDEELDEEASAS